jgi:type VII secretion-associated serine protease mycosin
VLAAGVRAGQSVRVSSVRVSAEGAQVSVSRQTGPEAARVAIAAAQADPEVVAVQVDRRVELGPLEVAPVRAAAVDAAVVRSDDSYRTDQWALDALRAEQLWGLTRGAGQVVAVIDTGVLGGHPDLAGQVLTGTDFVTPGGNGWDDGLGHGTHVAGIIAALAGNGVGVAGLAPAAKILPVRALDATGGGWDGDIASGVIWAADHGATVINLSVGGPNNSDAMRSAVSYAVGRGVVVLAAAGNERQAGNPVEYPAGFDLPGLLAVAATTSTRVSAPYSNTGAYVDVAAPGDAIVSTYLGGRYASMSGTSMATPYVAAAAALIRAAAPGMSAVDVTKLLVSSADDVERIGRDDDTGTGVIDPAEALCAVDLCPPGVTPSPTPSPSPTTSAGPASATALTVTVRGPGSPVVRGRTAPVHVLAADADGVVAGATVTVTAPGRTAHGSTGADGTATVLVAPVVSAGWTVTVSAPGHLTAHSTISVPVVPGVSVRWAGGQVAVTVAPARRQTVTVYEYSGGRWVARRKRVLATGPSGSITQQVAGTGRARVVISAADGLAAVTVQRG